MMATSRAGYEITAEDKTRAGIDSAKRGLKELGDSALNLKSVFGAALGAISAGALVSAFKSFTDGADSMIKLAQSTGQTVEELSALSHAAKLSDVDVSTLGSSLKKLAKNAVDTANGTGEAKDAFAALGISVRDASGNVRGTGDILLDIADKFSGLEDGSEKTALAMDLFGRSGADLIPLLNEGADGINALKQEAEALGIVLTTDTASAAEQLNDNLTRMSEAARGALIQTFSESLPVIAELSNQIVEFSKDTEAVKSAAEIANTGIKLLVSGGLIIKSTFDTLGTLIGGVAAAFVQFFHGVATFNLDELRASGETLKNVYTDVVDSASNDIRRMERVWNAVGDAANDAANDTKSASKNISTSLNDVSRSAKAAEKAASDYERSLQRLIDDLDPAAKATREYMQQVDLLDRAWIEGRISGEEYDRLMLLLATDTNAVEQRTKELAEAQEKAADERKKLAEREAEAMQRPFDQAAEGIQNSFTDAFANIYSGNIQSFRDMADQIKSVFVRLAAEITTLLVFNPRASVGALLGGTGLFGSGAASAGVSGVGISGGIPGISGLLNLGGGYGGAFLGAGGGALYGYQRGGIRGAVIGGLAGYTGGAALTAGLAAANAGFGVAGSIGAGILGASSALSAIPGIGLAALGALALFGGGRKKPSNRSAFGSIDLLTGATSGFGNMTGKKFSQETVDARDAFFQAIGAFSRELQRLTGGTIRGTVSADIGLRDGTQIAGTLLGSRKFANPQQALDAVFQAMFARIQGIDSQFRQVFSRLDTRNLEQAVQDLEIAASIINKDFVQPKPLNAAAQAIKELNDAFAPLISNAQRLGLSIRPIQAELSRLRNQMTVEFNASIDAAILSITDPLAAALQEFDRAAADRVANARSLGADLVNVERLNALERARIIEQFGAQANSALIQANQSIEQFLSGLRSGSGSFLSPTARLSNAESEFQALLSAAQAGDVSARGELSSAAGNLLSASRDVFGSSGTFFERLEFIDRTLSNLIGGSSTPNIDNIGATIAQGNATTEYQLDLVVNELRALRATVAEQQATLDRMVAA